MPPYLNSCSSLGLEMTDPHIQDASPPVSNGIAPHSEPPQASPGGAVLSPSRIPKKTNAESLPPPTPTGSYHHSSSSHGEIERSDSLDELILPEGVTLPPSVTPNMIDGRLRRTFLDLTPTQMKEILAEYDDAVREKGGEIRNRNAYLFGVVKRYKALANGGHNYLPQGHNLSPQVTVSIFPIPFRP
mmetsp:Transcript_43600/g.91637  ORF Transcript_43600/g.91637 Transcript_43600/m.91637 type:complete len:187 (+) Transcript_43600:457-1017(+)